MLNNGRRREREGESKESGFFAILRKIRTSFDPGAIAFSRAARLTASRRSKFADSATHSSAVGGTSPSLFPPPPFPSPFLPPRPGCRSPEGPGAPTVFSGRFPLLTLGPEEGVRSTKCHLTPSTAPGPSGNMLYVSAPPPASTSSGPHLGSHELSPHLLPKSCRVWPG